MSDKLELFRLHRDRTSKTNAIEAGQTSELKENEQSLFLDPVGILVSAMAADVPKTSAQPLSIAAQIDEILHLRLKESNLGDRPIRLHDQPESGVSVLVGTEQYRSIDEIPDLEVQSLNHQEVSEWERRGGG